MRGRIASAIVLPLFFSSIFFAACSPDQQSDMATTQDIATDINTARGTWLFFAEGSDVVRAMCAEGTQVPDRNSCQSEPVRVPGSYFYNELEKIFGGSIPDLERRLSASYTMIQRIDTRLLDLIDADPAPQRQDLKPLISARELDLAELDSRIAGVLDQIARIERELTLGEDPSLRSLLQDQHLKLATLKGERQVLQAQLRALRQDYITANATILDAMMFRDLQAQRDQHLTELESTKRQIDAQMEKLVQMHRVVKMMADQGFVYVITTRSAGFPEAKDIVREFDRAFNAADISWRSVPMQVASSGKWLVFDLPRSGKVDKFECHFEFNPAPDCRGLSIEAGGEHRYADGRSFTITPSYRSHPEYAVFQRLELSGQVAVKPVCRMIVTGSPRPWTDVKCTFLLQH